MLLDDAQFDYLLALMEGDPRALEGARGRQRAGGGLQQQHRAGAGGGGAGGGSAGRGSGAAAGAASAAAAAAAAAERASLVSQVKDLLPDYGDGFLAACLHEYGNSPEQVGGREDFTGACPCGVRSINAICMDVDCSALLGVCNISAGVYAPGRRAYNDKKNLRT